MGSRRGTRGSGTLIPVTTGPPWGPRHNFLMAARLFPPTPPAMRKTAGALSVRWTTANSIWWSGRNAMGGRGLLPRIAPMTGKSEPIMHYTAEQLKAKRQCGEGQTDWQDRKSVV